MTRKIKEWATIGGLILLGVLAMAGWGSHEKPAASACTVTKVVPSEKANQPPADKKHSGSIGALSNGAAGFVK
ncbi:MAG: hypothetical protein ACRD5L_13015 [Bryobacteraceae bacterium]